ncbi:MAG: hypothetical protein O2910_01720 [Proteobacteria bacterium]|nr:hypothetical protein [Pseudomonadota bacterium]
MSIWRGFFVLVPAFVILHLSAAGFLLPLIENGRDFAEIFELSRIELALLGLAFPIGYAGAVPKGAFMATGWSPRLVAMCALLGSILAAILFAFIAEGFWLMFIALLMSGGSAGVMLPLTTRLLGCLASLPRAGMMGLLIALAWGLSIYATAVLPVGAFAAALTQAGLPVEAPPAWASIFVLQAFLALVWLLPVSLLMPKQSPAP